LRKPRRPEADSPECVQSSGGVPRSDDESPTYTLVVLREDQEELATFDVRHGDVLVVGRDEGCDVRVNDPSVSRRHARLVFTDDVFVEDLGSANGTRVQGWKRGGTDGPGATEKASLIDTRLPRGAKTKVALGQVVLLGSAVLTVARAPGARQVAIDDAAGIRTHARPPIVLDPQMRDLYAAAERVAASPLTVLLLGETGTGKEVLAERIHRSSPRRDAPFVRLNCGAFTEALLESELFGHERGAFTGALRTKPGFIETAHGGTLLLDEVGELSPSLQVKLLRVLEERMVLRVGATHPRPVDVRFIAATHRDLAQAVREGRFRQDLFFRINGVCLYVPPLRERASEIIPLAQHFLESLCERTARSVPTLSADAVAWLAAQSWPGNVRELRNAVERATVLRHEGPLLREHFVTHAGPPAAQHVPAMATFPPPPPLASELSSDKLKAMLAEAERDKVVRALEACGGNQSRAAKMLGVSRGTLLVRMNQFGLPRPRRQ
jgi:two-component system, NtrC family, response regulator AtoC